MYPKRPPKMVGWRFAALIGGLVGSISWVMYVVAIKPAMHPQPWRDMQEFTRQGQDREAIQPGGMKIWTDPFDRK